MWGIRLLSWVRHRLARQIIVVGPGLRDRLLSRGVHPTKIQVVSNGVNTDMFRHMSQSECRNRLGLLQDAFYLCFVGTLAPWQGMETLIKAMSEIRLSRCDIRLLVVGDGPIRSKLEVLVSDLHLEDHVQFVGAVPRESVPVYINASDTCVVPKEYPFPRSMSPLKLFEYLACGVPVLASDVEGIRDILVQTQSGLTFKMGDARDLAVKAKTLMNDMQFKCSARQAGRDYVSQNHTWTMVAQAIFSRSQAIRVGAKLDDGAASL